MLPWLGYFVPKTPANRRLLCRRDERCIGWRLARPDSARSDRIPIALVERDQGERGRLPPAPGIPGRREEGRDAAARRHSQAHLAAQLGLGRRAPQRVRRLAQPQLRQDQRREQAGDS